MSDQEGGGTPINGNASEFDPRMVFQGNTFVHEVIRVDGRRFRNCVFRDCIIEFAATEPSNLISCKFDRCQWVAVGPALLTLRFLSMMYRFPARQGFVEATFDAIRHGASDPSNVTFPADRYDA